MNKQKKLLFIGGCGPDWPINTTPIQRGIALNPLFQKVLYINTTPSLSPFLEAPNTEYVQIKSYSEIIDIVKALSLKNTDLSIIHGPDWHISYQLLKIRRKVRFNWIIDLFDHHNLTSNIYLSKKKYMKYIYHKLSEKYLYKAIKQSDLLISAIAENEFLQHSNRIKCLNGVACQSISEVVEDSSSQQFEKDILHIGYIGVLSFERSNLIYQIINELYASNSNLRFKFHLVGDYDDDFIARVQSVSSQLVQTHFYGFVKWEQGIQIINEVDLCLYTFPVKNRPELDCVYPIKIGEYLALGKPIISVNSEGMREILDYVGESADLILIDENNVLKWKEKIVSNAFLKVDSKSVYTSMNNEIASRKLSWEIIHKPLLAVI